MMRVAVSVRASTQNQVHRQLDRLARNYVHPMGLLEEFAHPGCQVEFLDRPISQDPHDPLLLQIRGAVAEYERILITERMRRGRLAKLRAGVLLPWTRAPVCCRWRARRIRSPTGKPVWGLATVRGILSNPAYTGQVYMGRMRYRSPRIRRSATHPIGRPHARGTLVPPEEWIPVATIPAIVTQAQSDLTQRKLAKNRSFARRHNTAHPYLLRACIGRTLAHSPYAYYVCSGKIKPAAAGGEPCPARFAPAGPLDDLVWQALCEVLPPGGTHAGAGAGSRRPLAAAGIAGPP